jgi:hypothetical protein
LVCEERETDRAFTVYLYALHTCMNIYMHARMLFQQMRASLHTGKHSMYSDKLFECGGGGVFYALIVRLKPCMNVCLYMCIYIYIYICVCARAHV